jgi:hypothetical protein
MSFYNKMRHTESDPLSIRFFSNSNVNDIQNQVIKQIKHETGVNISAQSETDVFHFMTGVLNMSQEPIPSDSKEFTRLLMRLNYEAIRLLTDNVKQGILMHILYLKDASALPAPIPRSLPTTKDTSMRGFF